MIPRPVAHRPDPRGGRFVLTASTRLVADPALRGVADLLHAALAPATGFPLPVIAAGGDTSPGAVRLRLDDTLAAEGYRLRVEAAGIEISGGSPAGAFYGVQTLRQLLPAAVFRAAPVTGVDWSVPAGETADEPAFGWRGFMLDVARSFLPKADVLRVIDQLAAHKLNVLHLHLTDDQGWRVQIERYPRLTEVGAWRRESMIGWDAVDPRHDGRPHGGFYTKDDLREIVAYAAARFIDVVPEIDLPGHVSAVLAAYPELGVDPARAVEVATGWGIFDEVLNLEESTLQWVKDVLDEVVEIFPGPYVHLGGDECRTTQWESDPRSLARMAELGLTDVGQVQGWYLRELTAHLAGRGKRVIGWDEVLEAGDLPASVVVSSWRGAFGGIAAARAGHDVIMAPMTHVYLDHRESDRPDEPVPVGFVVPVERVYEFAVVPPELDPEQARRVLGAQAQMWTEHTRTLREIEYKVFPRLCAFAETVWSPPPARDTGDFLARLDTHLTRLAAAGVEFRPRTGPLPWQTKPGVHGWDPELMGIEPTGAVGS